MLGTLGGWVWDSVRWIRKAGLQGKGKKESACLSKTKRERPERGKFRKPKSLAKKKPGFGIVDQAKGRNEGPRKEKKGEKRVRGFLHGSRVWFTKTGGREVG